MSKAYKWGCCDSNDDDRDYILCVTCNKRFHLKCTGRNRSASSSQWKCPDCSDKQVCRDDTPTRHKTDNVTKRSAKRPALKSPPSSNVIDSMSKMDVSDIVSEAIKTEMSLVMKELKSTFASIMKSELADIKNEMREMRESMNFINNQYEEFKLEHEKTVKILAKVQDDNIKLQSTVSILNNRIEQMEQHTRCNNFEIQCVPESKSENLVATVLKLGKILQCPISEDQILLCTRIAKMDRASPRPRSIVVQLNSNRLRDHLIAAVINFNKRQEKGNKLNTTHLGIMGEAHPIYISEHLSPSNKALHAATRIKANEKKYKYVWVRGGKIFVRKDDEARYLVIKDVDSLNKLVV